jgi:hypothetical protein
VTVTRQDFEDAIAAYWGAKQTQTQLSVIKNKVGAGTAGSVRGGKHFDSIAALIAKFFLDAGYPASAIRVNKGQRLELPGYFRPTKQWDIVVSHKDTLVAAFELKALGGPSFGNNYNNRVEEALGSAFDLRRAALAKIFPGEKPWLGYFFILEDAIGSRRPVRIDEGAFPSDKIWHGASYQKRFSVFCERLMAEGIYDSVCYITSSPTDTRPTELVSQLDWQHFSAAVNARIAFLHGVDIP